ncbi:hypothetical protein ASPZODRAFT_889667 [Penicilliopsis zonata CBS 506.65]|uniref:SnoaL-like domain-containing protein n=1 Tax=Penicilliopsis zonata CBS 506.65 TaxID=1073090 RepID=A0A1L9S9M5_9EURO|nr:hypothetical protein ASPZODRAFT_889667 [Penicilliopsis zonata CBS 506.65]OJJ43871.1 hypothetical protein ASPZODRAFT_889667 [Penicilliopsis zonata CBS 506.65]
MISILFLLLAPLMTAWILPLQTRLEAPGCDGSGIVDPHGRCNGDGIIEHPENPYPYPYPPDGRWKDREGFVFDNPSTDCAFVSQPEIWDSFKVLEKDMTKLFTRVHREVDFTVMGHHPVAGHYHDLLHFYVNALRRVSNMFLDHAELFEIHPRAIHGGCNSQWSVQEINFKGKMNSGMNSRLFSFTPSFNFFFLTSYLGDDFDVVNVWVTKWDKRHQIVECRTYIDAPRIIDGMFKNELWLNASSIRENLQYIPGPGGMPDLKELEDLMGYPDGRKYEN